MKTKLFIVASALLLAGPAFAQEPLEQRGTEPPATQNAPAPNQTAPEPLGEAQPSTTAPQQNAAQQPLDMNAMRKSRDDNKMVNQLGTDVDTVEDMDIFDANGRKIAEVEGVIEDQNGQIVGLIIEHGGFLGLGETESIITFDQVELQNGNLKTMMTEESLPQLPRWTKD